MYAIKIRLRGSKSKAWHFMTSRGEATRLRVHAALFATKELVEHTVAIDSPANPEIEFKVVEL